MQEELIYAKRHRGGKKFLPKRASLVEMLFKFNRACNERVSGKIKLVIP